MKILCKIFGHKVDSVDLLMLNIKNVAENRDNFKQELEKGIICKRCGEKITAKK